VRSEVVPSVAVDRSQDTHFLCSRSLPSVFVYGSIGQAPLDVRVATFCTSCPSRAAVPVDNGPLLRPFCVHSCFRGLTEAWVVICCTLHAPDEMYTVFICAL